uniref:L,D-transpeptidase family protein n=1 Tax=Roseomonas rosulenta TaxID=2748667 RepID=UPI0018DF444B
VLSRGGAAILAAGGLGACAAPPPPQPPAAARIEETPLARLLRSTSDLAIAGEPLDAAALRRFYARRGFNPVWPARQGQADELVALVLRAGDHGLDPEMFHGGLLRRRDELPPLRREVVVTDALLSYADALSHGAVPADRRTSAEAMAPDAVDLAAALDEAIDNDDPVVALEGLAPQTQTYLGLRLAMRGRLLRAPRLPGGAAAAAQRQRSIEANLERERWLPRQLPPDRVWVNVPDQQLVFYRDNRRVFTTAVVVGDNAERNQTPEFHTLIEAGFFNPPWVIPRDIVAAEILPRLERDPEYLARNNMVMRANGEIEQSAGPEAGLGFLLFDMPNRFDVYLHDTPDRFLFSRSNRRMSRGCIRVQNPRELASLLMDLPIDEIDRRIATGRTSRRPLPAPVPVFITYRTAFVDAEGALQFRQDFYDRDATVWRRLRKQPPA